jgi:hypothetical protein
MESKKKGVPVSAVLYLRPRSATVVVYLPGNYYRAVSAKVGRKAAEGVLRMGRVRRRWGAGRRTECVSLRAPFEAVAPLLVGNKRLVSISYIDSLFKAAYARSAEVRELLLRRALERMFGDAEAAEAYLKAWLKAENFMLSPDDPDARRAARANPSVVYSVGRERYSLQVPPWA